MADITINHVISGTLTVDGDLTGHIVPTSVEPKLETLNVRIDPSQAQTLTPGASIDGWNEVKVPQAMAISVSTDFVIAMGGNAYDTIAGKNYIAVYDNSGRNVTKFTKGAGGGGGILNTGVNEELASYSYYGNTGIDEIVCPNVTTVAGSAFESAGFKTVRFTGTGNLYIDNGAFKNAGLKDLYLHSSTMTSLGSNYAFQGVTGLTIHVPQNLLATYQANGMWSSVNCTWVALD